MEHEQIINPLYPLTTSFMVILHRGDDFLLKKYKDRLSGLYYKPDMIHVDIRSAVCRYLHKDKVETHPDNLKLLGIMDTEGHAKSREEHMFVYICYDFEYKGDCFAWSRFTGQPSISFHHITETILSCITQQKPLPIVLDNRIIY